VLVAVVLALVPAFQALRSSLTSTAEGAPARIFAQNSVAEPSSARPADARTWGAAARYESPASRGSWRVALADNELDPSPPTKPNPCYGNPFSTCTPGEIEPLPGPPSPEKAPSGSGPLNPFAIPELPLDPGVNINVPAVGGPSIQINVPGDRRPQPLINVPGIGGVPPPLINVPGSTGVPQPLINVPAQSGPTVNADSDEDQAETDRETHRANAESEKEQQAETDRETRRAGLGASESAPPTAALPTDKESLHALSKQGNVDATYQYNLLQAPDAESAEQARGYLYENQLIDRYREDVVEAGHHFEYQTDRGHVQSDIDVETTTRLIQAKSGTRLPSDNQVATTELRARETGKKPTLVYDPARLPRRAVEDFKKRNPGWDFIVVPYE